MSRKIKYKPNEYIEKCPKCGNNTDFTVHSQQVCEDGCEIWAVCKCGYKPTESSMEHLEDVWGGTDDDNCRDAIDCTWNEPIQNKVTSQTTPQP